MSIPEIKKIVRSNSPDNLNEAKKPNITGFVTISPVLSGTERRASGLRFIIFSARKFPTSTRTPDRRLFGGGFFAYKTMDWE